MATIDGIVVEVQQNINRAVFYDANGVNITTAYLSSLVNKSLHELEALEETPFQTFTYQLSLVAQQQVYPLQPSGTTLAYRGTQDITVPNQVSLTANLGANGWRVNYMTHADARQKYQLVPSNQILPGPPTDYSIYSCPVQLPGMTLSGTPSLTGGFLPAGPTFWTLTAVINGVETTCLNEYTVTIVGNTAKVAFTWTPITNPSLSCYKLYRGPMTGGENVFYLLPPSSSSYTDLGTTGTAPATGPYAGSPLVPYGSIGPTAAYWTWPSPNQYYFANVDQAVFLPDLVYGQIPAQFNWFTLFCPDALIYDATLKSLAALKDADTMKIYSPLRSMSWDAAIARVAGLQFDEMGLAAQMIEPG